jgi:hypothetical protein
MNGTIVEIFDDNTTGTIQFVTDAGDTTNIKVDNIKIYLDEVDQIVYCYDNSQSLFSKGTGAYEPCFYTLDYLQITTPSEANAGDLYSVILGYIASASAGGGDASAANQLTEIARLNTLIAKDFSTAANQSTEIARLNTLIAKDFATETTLVFVKNRLFDAGSGYSVAEWQPLIYSRLGGIKDAVDALNTIASLRLKNSHITRVSFSNATLAGLLSDIATYDAANPGLYSIEMVSFPTATTYDAIVTYSNV